MTKDLENIKQSLLHQRLLAFLESAPGIVHNINNPLTIISTRAQLLQMKMPGNQDFKKMTEQSKAIEAILNNLVFISQNISNDQLRKFDINTLLKNEMEFLNADALFKHNTSKVFQFYQSPLIITSSYFHISTLVYCIMQVLLVQLKDSVENKITIISEKALDSVRFKIGSRILNHREVNNFISSISSPSDSPHLTHLSDAKRLANEIGITLLINNNSDNIEFTVSIPLK
ncbi:MAG: hypothetical protein JXR87_10745 [Candidatus Marinimicrobia bacterium]|nr:hypothetical protein [Candidatus Neomarinimicrobiota bacterium]